MHKEKRFSPVFILPTGTPGVKFICLNSYELNAGTNGRPFDAPLASRLVENDSILILDNVFVPWENVLMYGVEMSNQFITQSGFLNRTLFHGCTRLAVKLDFITGLLLKAVEITGTNEFRGVQAAVGEVIALRHFVWALSDAMAKSSDPWVPGYVLPNLEAALAYRNFGHDAYSQIRNLIFKIAGSALIYLPSSAADFEHPELRQYIDKYIRGSNNISALERVKVFKLLWDAIGSEFGSRHELYELNYAGAYEQGRVDALNLANLNGLSNKMKSFVDQCMSEYNIEGWTVTDLSGSETSSPQWADKLQATH
jgi:4-hydroxyphenylacetate 3-monooxygenase